MNFFLSFLFSRSARRFFRTIEYGKTFGLSTLLLFASVLPARATETSEASPEYVLLLNTYTETVPWIRTLSHRISEFLAEEKPGVSFFTEDMNLFIFDTREEIGEYSRNLFEKYRKRPPKALLVLGCGAWSTLRDSLANRWPDVPVLLCAEFDFLGPAERVIRKEPVPENEKIALSDEVRSHPNLHVIYNPRYIRETLEIMNRIHPEMDRLFFVSDNRYISAESRKIVRETLERHFPNVRPQFLTEGEISTDSLLLTLQTADPSTGVLFFTWFQQQYQSGNTILSTNLYSTIGSFCPQPIFTLFDHGNNDTRAGGVIIPVDTLTQRVEAALIPILEGRGAEIPTEQSGGNPLPILNYQNLVDKGVPERFLPEEAVYLFKPVSLLARYKYGITSVATLLVTVFVFLFLRNRHERKELRLLSKYHSLFDTMPIVFIQIELLREAHGQYTDAIIREVNPTFVQVFGPAETAIGKRFSELDDPKRHEFLDVCRLILSSGKKTVYPRCFENRNRYYDVLIAPAEEKNRLNLFYIDNTELRKTQQQLQTTNHKLSLAFEVANIIPWKWDLKHKTILCDVNKPIGPEGLPTGDDEIFSVPEAEYFATICKDDRRKVKQAYLDLIEGRTTKVMEEYRVLTHREHALKYEWVEAKATVDRRDADGRPATLIGSLLVITERKTLEEDLISAKEQAEESNRLKSKFLANMSHEIRTPLNAIVGFSNMLATVDESAEKQEYIDIIETNNALLLQLINDILDLSKIEAGTLEFVDSDFDLNHLLSNIERSTKLKAAEKAIVVSFSEPETGCRIHSEKNRLNQVLTNLLNNAVKFTARGSIRFGYRILPDDMLRFFVTDTGCGIPREKQQSVFNRFVKLDNFTQGSGLGLSICQTIVRNMGGEIGVESEVNAGSTFWFTWPYRPARQPVAPNIESIAPIRLNSSKLKILIAEDNPSNFKLFESIFKHDYRIIHARNGEEAVALFQEHVPQIILMDINMPVKDGYEATKEIRKVSKNVPIIAVTAYAYATDEQRIMASGFDDYTAKPIHIKTLKQKVIDLINKRMVFLV